MPDINILSLRDALGGATPSEWNFSAQLMAIGPGETPIPAVRVEGYTVTFPEQVTAVYGMSGTPEILTLDVPPANTWWKITLSSGSGDTNSRKVLNVVFPESAGPFDIEDLVEIDYLTFAPLDPSTAITAAGAMTSAATSATSAAASAASAADSAASAASAVADALVDYSTTVEADATYTAQAREGVANGVATLDGGGKIVTGQLPALVITDAFPVSSQAAMLALDAQRGDVAVRSDLSKTFILAAEPATVLGNWMELATPTDSVASVAGKTGVVTLVKGDVGLGSVDNTADANKPVSGPQQTALDANAAASDALVARLVVSNWTARTSAANNAWYSVVWSPELGLFCAVAVSGTGNRVMTSPDGITWTIRTSAADNNWASVAWSPALSLFCAVAATGTGNCVMTSPDGITWTARTSAADNAWLSVAWSPELSLFCAVSYSGTGNRVMTSPDGITWTARTSAADNGWLSVAWSPELSLFCAVAATGTGNRVMTSPDGITWTIRTSAADNAWRGVVWSPELGLFCAVANSGTGNRVMTSPDGITWTARTSAADNGWRGVVWSPELGLFCAVSETGPGNRVMTSPDGITWTARTSAADNAWYSVAWSPELSLFCAVANSGTGNRVMTSLSLS